MASCDFSTHEYSYDDQDGDFNMTYFNLTDEDFKYKVVIATFLKLFYCIFRYLLFKAHKTCQMEN